jgi:hypothetical protein
MVDRLPPPIFIADALGLDFINTRAVPVDTEVEWIGSGEDFVGWMQTAELVPAEVVAALRKGIGQGSLQGPEAERMVPQIRS